MALTKVGKEGITGISNSSDATAITIDSSENVGIGTASPSSKLNVVGAGSVTGISIKAGGDSNVDPFKVTYANGTEGDFFTIDDGGRVGIGTASPATTAHIQTSSGNPELRVESTGANYATMSVKNSSRHYSTQIRTDQSNAYVIRDETAGANRFLIDTSGHILIGQSTSDSPGAGDTVLGSAIRSTGIAFFSADGSGPLRLNRETDDGVLINFSRGGTAQGSIGVSSGTVSLTGAHLSRWSQATDGNRISGLLRGTVMTNLDQMAVWHHEAKAATYYEEGDELPEGVSVGDEKTPAADAYDEDNEQLNCMAVSSVEGDANVAGVFQSWDDDDDVYLNDMIIAMTGDFIIRIASGTTVARGDLLMSAGDGTAKPQGDDIVRSKTIAKVISTTVSKTYDDGTYLVPCVLMAC